MAFAGKKKNRASVTLPRPLVLISLRICGAGAPAEFLVPLPLVDSVSVEQLTATA
jgi:hypothetical protein